MNNKWMKKFIWLLLCLCLSFSQKKHVLAQEITIPFEDEMDYESVQDVVDDVLGEGSFNFKDYIYNAVKTGNGFSMEGMFTKILDAIKAQMEADKNLVFRFLGIALLGAVFTNFSKVFRNNQVSEMGFYVTYLILFSLSAASFYSITQVAVDTLSQILDFMRAMIPAYYMAVTFTSGVGTSTIFYQATLLLIQFVEFFIVHGIIPMIRIYFVLCLINNLSKENMLSKAMELLDTIIRWTLKSLLGLITGYNVIQGLIVPVANTMRNKIAVKAVNAIPGVGSIIGSAAETVLGAGIVLKNAIGVAGICVLLIILSIPAVRIGFYTLIYKAAAAVVQPISDKRIVECLSSTAKASALLLYATFVGGILFLLTILVVMATTNGSVS